MSDMAKDSGVEPVKGPRLTHVTKLKLAEQLRQAEQARQAVVHERDAIREECSDLLATTRDALAMVDRLVQQVTVLEDALRTIARGPLVRDHRRHARRALALFESRAVEEPDHPS